MSHETIGNEEHFPDKIPDFSNNSEKRGILLTCNYAHGIMSNVQFMSQQMGIEPAEVFLRITTLGINIDEYRNSKGGLYKKEEGFSRRIDLADEEFGEDPDVLDLGISNDKLPRLDCRLSSGVHQELLQSSLDRNMPVEDIARRGVRMATAVIMDIMQNDAEYFVWEFDGESPYMVEEGTVREAGDIYPVDIGYFFMNPDDSEIPL